MANFAGAGVGHAQRRSLPPNSGRQLVDIEWREEAGCLRSAMFR